MKKQTTLILAATLILLLIFVYLLVKNSRVSKRLPAVLQGATNASLTLSPGSGEPINVGETTDLNVFLNTDGAAVHGADVMLEYDSNKLSVANIVPNTTETSIKTFAPVVEASEDVFDWQKAVNQGQSLIEFGAAAFDLGDKGADPDNPFPNAAPTPAFNGTTSLARITLQANPVRRNSAVQLSFIDNNSTDDSNIIVIDGDSVNDILGVTGQAAVKIIAQPVCRAAVNNDQDVNVLDLSAVVGKWGTSCPDCFEDPNGDGSINVLDLSFIVSYWGQQCNIAG